MAVNTYVINHNNSYVLIYENPTTTEINNLLEYRDRLIKYSAKYNKIGTQNIGYIKITKDPDPEKPNYYFVEGYKTDNTYLGKLEKNRRIIDDSDKNNPIITAYGAKNNKVVNFTAYNSLRNFVCSSDTIPEENLISQMCDLYNIDILEDSIIKSYIEKE